MDCTKVGAMIRNLRTEKKMTQSDLANRLNVSNKTISKWECGLGCPDISLIAELSEILEVDISYMLKGDLTSNDFAGGNMKNTTFYICPVCGSISVHTGQAQTLCCGRKVEEQLQQKATDSEKLNILTDDDEWYITSDHPMNKDNYITFVAFLTGDRLQLIKLYPEWDLSLRIPRQGHGKLIWFSTTKGLFYQLI